MKDKKTMTNKDNAENNEKIIDAKAETTAVAVQEPTAVSTEVSVQGVQLNFPFIRLGQGMSQWKCDGKKPQIGCFYVGKNKENNVLIAEAGKENGIRGIVLQRVNGFKEDRKWVAGMGAPRRWVVAGVKEDGTPVTEKDCLEAAAKEGFSIVKKPTGEVYKDSGKPVVRANLSPFCYLCMLVPLPDDFESSEYPVYPIGDKLYTTARFEFDRGYYTEMNSMLLNRKGFIEYRHRKAKDLDYKWTINGLPVILYSEERRNRDGIEYIAPALDVDLVNGLPREMSQGEKEDFLMFLAAAKGGAADISEVSGDSEF